MCHVHIAAARRWNADALGRIRVELVPQRPYRDGKNAGGVRPIAETLRERRQDQIALNIGHGAPDQAAYCGIRRCRSEPAIGFNRPPNGGKKNHSLCNGHALVGFVVENTVNEPHQFLAAAMRDHKQTRHGARQRFVWIVDQKTECTRHRGKWPAQFVTHCCHEGGLHPWRLGCFDIRSRQQDSRKL